MQLRKIIKNRGHFPSDEAATKLLTHGGLLAHPAREGIQPNGVASKRVVTTALTRYLTLISSVNASWFIALSTASSSRCISEAKVSSLRRTSAASMP